MSVAFGQHSGSIVPRLMHEWPLAQQNRLFRKPVSTHVMPAQQSLVTAQVPSSPASTVPPVHTPF